MASPVGSSEEIAKISALIQRCTANVTRVVDQVAALDLRQFSYEDVALILAQLDPEKEMPRQRSAASASPPARSRGPRIGSNDGLVAAVALATPALYVKAPPHLVAQSIRTGAALCVNRFGGFRLLMQGYSVVSHVWDETMGRLQTPNGGGAVELLLPLSSERGLSLMFLKASFDRCAEEWLWIDVLAIPQVHEDILEIEKVETEKLRAGIINTLGGVYQRADQVIVLDTTLLRLHTRSMIDVAVILAVSKWITRLWCFTQSWLAKSVVIKTADWSFKLDELISFFYGMVHDDEDRYYLLFQRLSFLRPPSEENPPFVPLHLRSADHRLFVIARGCEYRTTGVEIDQARALYPILNLQWTSGWSLEDGLTHIRDSFPEQRDYLKAYCKNQRSNCLPTRLRG